MVPQRISHRSPHPLMHTFNKLIMEEASHTRKHSKTTWHEQHLYTLILLFPFLHSVNYFKGPAHLRQSLKQRKKNPSSEQLLS